jgi:hypothetical protein
MTFFIGILRKDKFISLPYNMSALYTGNASSVSVRLIYKPSMVSMTMRISIYSCLLCCRKYKITATSTKRSIISQHASAYPNKIKLVLPYLETLSVQLVYGLAMAIRTLHISI